MKNKIPQTFSEKKKKDGLFRLKDGCQSLHEFAALLHPTLLLLPNILWEGFSLLICLL